MHTELKHARGAVGVLFSGGLDSAVLVGQLLKTNPFVQPIYIRAGLIWEDAEFEWAHRFHETLADERLGSIVSLELPVDDLYSDHWSLTGRGTPDYCSKDLEVFLPGRNIMLASKAAIWCQLQGINQLYLAPLGSSPFPDASAPFLEQFGNLLSLGMGHPGDQRSINLLCPFSRHQKADVLRLGCRLPLEMTFSCLAPVDRQHCGQCNKCRERCAAFATAGVADPTVYVYRRTTVTYS